MRKKTFIFRKEKFQENQLETRKKVKFLWQQHLLLD